MRSFTLVLVFAACVIFGSSLSAVGASRRQYLEVRTCSVQPGKIVVTTDTQIFEVKRLRTDAKGAYICPSDLISVRAIEALSATGPNEMAKLQGD